MDEARTVLARLERIEALECAGGSPGDVLGELRLLLAEAEAWVRAEHGGTGRAEAALAAARERLELRGDVSAQVARTEGRTLLA